MKAKDLIDMLSKIDPDTEVLLWEESEMDGTEMAWCSKLSHVLHAATFKDEIEHQVFDISYFAPVDRPDVVPVVILHHDEIPPGGEVKGNSGFCTISRPVGGTVIDGDLTPSMLR